MKQKIGFPKLRPAGRNAFCTGNTAQKDRMTMSAMQNTMHSLKKKKKKQNCTKKKNQQNNRIMKGEQQ